MTVMELIVQHHRVDAQGRKLEDTIHPEDIYTVDPPWIPGDET